MKLGPERSNPLEAFEAAVEAGYTSVRFPYEEDLKRACSPFFCAYCGKHLRTHFLTIEVEIKVPAAAVLVPEAEDDAYENDTDY